MDSHPSDKAVEAGWHFAAKADEVEDDVPSLVVVGDRQIALCRLGDAFYAIDNICTHEYACFTDGFIEGEEVECPLHQARFHIPSGTAMGAPATEDLRTYDVRREGEAVYVRVDDAEGGPG